VNFSVLPPEINSLRMFLGAGSAPMLQAAAAWQGLAEELGTAADSFVSVTTGLAGQAWQGPASVAMSAAAAPYAGWLSAAAAQSAGAAGQAQMVASVFEAAQAAIIHPGAVNANRNAFVQLVMSNVFGQNAPAIAMAESIYEEMWAADVAAMAGYYSGASSVAAQVVPWQTVLQNSLGLVAGLGSGLAGGASGMSSMGSGPVSSGGSTAGSGNAGGGASSAGDGSSAAGGGGGANSAGGGSYANNVGSQTAGAGLAPADSSYASGNMANNSIAGGSATSANTGYASQGVGGFGMMPMPMPMGGANVASAGLLSDGPIGGAKPATEKTESATEAPETPASPAAEEAAPPTPQMGVLATSSADAAPTAAPTSETGAKPATVSGIRESALRIAATGSAPTWATKTQDERASESATDEAEKVPSLRPAIAPGEFRPQAKEEEDGGIQLRGG
jgi:hypothetical protein